MDNTLLDPYEKNKNGYETVVILTNCCCLPEVVVVVEEGVVDPELVDVFFLFLILDLELPMRCRGAPHVSKSLKFRKVPFKSPSLYQSSSHTFLKSYRFSRIKSLILIVIELFMLAVSHLFIISIMFMLIRRVTLF